MGEDIRSQNQKRTAMGEYIVPKDGKPLTSLGDGNPAPSDYSPKVDITRHTPPHFSIAGPYKAKLKAFSASPADNDTSRDLIWRDRSISIKGKGRSNLYGSSTESEKGAIGPAQYLVEYHSIGKGGTKYSVAKRQLRADTGPPNELVSPVDTHGFITPGPNQYRPSSSYWGRGSKKTFGSSRGKRINEIMRPGPAEYSIKEKKTGPAWTLARRLQPPSGLEPDVNSSSPGPGSYDIGTTIGQTTAKSIGGRCQVVTKNSVPAPNEYSLPDIMRTGPNAVTMTYRTFEPEDKPSPAPNRYYITHADLSKQASYSIRLKPKPCFPEILNYPLKANLHSNPGPGNYEEKREITRNDEPKFSMGRRTNITRDVDSFPGPNHYTIKLDSKPNAKRAPEFSMGKRIDNRPEKNFGPGPAAYNTQSNKGFGGGTEFGHSMTKRPVQSKKFISPAPNAYMNVDGQTRNGKTNGPSIKFKSRASPYVFSGFRTTHVLEQKVIN